MKTRWAWATRRHGVIFLRLTSEPQDPNRYVLPSISITWEGLMANGAPKLIFRGIAISWWHRLAGEQ
jgi:hypothetical protein